MPIFSYCLISLSRCKQFERTPWIRSMIIFLKYEITFTRIQFLLCWLMSEHFGICTQLHEDYSEVLQNIQRRVQSVLTHSILLYPKNSIQLRFVAKQAVIMWSIYITYLRLFRFVETGMPAEFLTPKWTSLRGGKFFLAFCFSFCLSCERRTLKRRHLYAKDSFSVLN